MSFALVKRRDEWCLLPYCTDEVTHLICPGSKSDKG